MLKKVLVILVLSIASIYFLCSVFVNTDGDKNFTFTAVLMVIGAYAVIIPVLFSNETEVDSKSSEHNTEDTKVKQTSDDNII